MIKVGIVGISGYSGMSVFEYLLKHPNVCVSYVSANNTEGKVTDIWPQFTGRTNLHCSKFDIIKASACDCVFLAVPHTTAMKIAPKLIKRNVRVIDLSGDYRLGSVRDYKKWYKVPHEDAKNLRKSVYGLPELYRENIKTADLIANPGCYPTAAILGLAPLLSTYGSKIGSILIDAKSGVSGAGKKASVALNYCEVNENFKAYKVLDHQHAPEIELYLSKCSKKEFPIQFVPHLLPINRGILETIYVQLKKPLSPSHIQQLYDRFYKTEPFVRVLKKGQQPELKYVAKTNFCDIGLTLNKEGNWLVITSAIDNLVKGAAGQAVQNMNLMFHFKESESLL